MIQYKTKRRLLSILYYKFDHGVTYAGAASRASFGHTVADVVDILQVIINIKTYATIRQQFDDMLWRHFQVSIGFR